VSGAGQSKAPSKAVEPELIGVGQPGAPIPKPLSGAQATLDQELDELDSLMESLDAEGKGAKAPPVQPKVAPTVTAAPTVTPPQPVRSDVSRVGASPITHQPVQSRVATTPTASHANAPPRATIVASVPPQPAVVPAPVAVSPPLPPDDEPLPPKPSRSMVSGASTIAELDDIDSFLSSLDDGKGAKGKSGGNTIALQSNAPPKKGSKMEELNDLDKFMDDLIDAKPTPKAAPEKKKPTGSTSRIDMNELDDLMNSLLN